MSPEQIDIPLSISAGVLAGWLFGTTFAQVRAAKDRDLLIMGIVRLIQFTALPRSAALASCQQACREFRGAIVDRVASLDGIAVRTLREQEARPDA